MTNKFSHQALEARALGGDEVCVDLVSAHRFQRKVL
jgi:hypothetical protein